LKRATWVLIVIASIAAAIWWWSGNGGNPAPETALEYAADARAANHVESRHDLPRKDGPEKIGPGAPGQTPLIDVRALFRASKDYWAFAELIHAAAKRGDGASQYYLSVALDTCDFLYRGYFMEQRPGAPARIRTLDEAQQLTASRKGSGYTPDDVRDIQSRCQRIMSTKPPPFGIAAEWMDAAVESGYPLAQVSAAFYKALQARKNPDPDKSRAEHGEARALAFDALRSKDPEVVWWMASTAAALTGDEPGEVHKRQWTWRMAACLREANCDSMTEWKSLLCEADSQCHRDDTVMDIIRRGAGNDYGEIERRARELNEKIDAGTVDEDDI
jgi:hypothetical protein